MIDVDRERHRIGLQGEWWFRGEYALESQEHGCLLTYRVFNVAPWPSRLLAPLVTRGYAGISEQARLALEGMLQRIGARLGCRTEVRGSL